MSQGGGFCPKHGPFDPPHTTCPFCVREDPQRRSFGPPVVPSFQGRPKPAGPPAPDESLDEFSREVFEPEDIAEPDIPQVTELAPVQAPDGTVLDLPKLPEGAHLPLGWLVVKDPEERRGEVLPVKHGQVIGREGDIRWADNRLSRQHARFTIEPLGETIGGKMSDTLVFHLWPFAPTNPVFINGIMVRAATPLNENDEILLGETLFVFKVLTD